MRAFLLGAGCDGGPGPRLGCPSALVHGPGMPCVVGAALQRSAGLSRLKPDSLGGNPGDDQVVAALPAPWTIPQQPDKVLEFSMSIFVGFPN